MKCVCHLRHTGEPPNKGHFGDGINSTDLFFVESFSSLGGSKCILCPRTFMYEWSYVTCNLCKLYNGFSPT